MSSVGIRFHAMHHSGGAEAFPSAAAVKKLRRVSSVGSPVVRNADLNSQIGLFSLKRRTSRRRGIKETNLNTAYSGLTAAQRRRPVRELNITVWIGPRVRYAYRRLYATVCAAHPAHSLPSFTTLCRATLPPVLAPPFELLISRRRRLRHLRRPRRLWSFCLCLWWLCCPWRPRLCRRPGLLVQVLLATLEPTLDALVPVLALRLS